MSFFLAAAHAICHHRAEVGVLTSSRSPCFGIWTILTPVFTLPAFAEESDPSQPFSGWIATNRQYDPCLKTIILAIPEVARFIYC